MLQVAVIGYNLQSVQNKSHTIVAEFRPRALLCAIIASLKKLRRWHITHCNLSATLLATPLRDKLQRKLHRVTLPVELDSTARS